MTRWTRALPILVGALGALWAAGEPGLASGLATKEEAEASSLELNCELRSIVDVVFGTYDPVAGTPVDGVGQITINCEEEVDVLRIKLDSGQGGSFWPRSMNSGGDTLPYNLYRDAARTTVWGDGTSSTSFLTLWEIDEEEDHTFAVYGRIEAGENASAGVYSDQVMVTIDF